MNNPTNTFAIDAVHTDVCFVDDKLRLRVHGADGAVVVVSFTREDAARLPVLVAEELASVTP